MSEKNSRLTVGRKVGTSVFLNETCEVKVVATSSRKANLKIFKDGNLCQEGWFPTGTIFEVEPMDDVFIGITYAGRSQTKLTFIAPREVVIRRDDSKAHVVP